MSIKTNILRCPNCGKIMKYWGDQYGAKGHYKIYHCHNCNEDRKVKDEKEKA